MAESVLMPLGNHGHHSGHNEQRHLLPGGPGMIEEKISWKNLLIGGQQKCPLHQQATQLITLQRVQQIALCCQKEKKCSNVL